MAEVDTRSWWTEVEHLREPLERRSGARRGERRPIGDNLPERRTIKIRGQSVAGAPRRELRDVPEGRQPSLYDLELAAASRSAALDSAPPGQRQPLASRPARPRRPSRRPRERIGSRPDRIAGWAVLFVLLMALIAATSAHGATQAALAGGLRSASGARMLAVSASPSRPFSTRSALP